MKERIIFHIDVNNAFLSWTAVLLLKNGYKWDIRKIPSIIGGDESKRHGIVLAKSPVAKNMESKQQKLYMKQGESVHKSNAFQLIINGTMKNQKNYIIICYNIHHK